MCQCTNHVTFPSLEFEFSSSLRQDTSFSSLRAVCRMSTVAAERFGGVLDLKIENMVGLFGASGRYTFGGQFIRLPLHGCVSAIRIVFSERLFAEINRTNC